MADTVQFELVAPEKLIFSDDVELVVVPGSEGDFGVLPGHANLISTVRPGIIEVHENGQAKERYFVAGGYAEVTAERCTVLSTEAMPVDAIERGAAEKRLEAAELGLRDADDDAARSRFEEAVDVARAMVGTAGP